MVWLNSFLSESNFTIVGQTQSFNKSVNSLFYPNSN